MSSSASSKEWLGSDGGVVVMGIALYSRDKALLPCLCSTMPATPLRVRGEVAPEKSPRLALLAQDAGCLRKKRKRLAFQRGSESFSVVDLHHDAVSDLCACFGGEVVFERDLVFGGTVAVGVGDDDEVFAVFAASLEGKV